MNKSNAKRSARSFIFIVLLFCIFLPLGTEAVISRAKQSLLQRLLIDPLATLFEPFFTPQLVPVPVVKADHKKATTTQVAGTSTSVTIVNQYGPVPAISKSNVLEWIKQLQSDSQPLNVQNITYLRSGSADGLANSLSQRNAEVQSNIDSLTSSFNSLQSTFNSLSASSILDPNILTVDTTNSRIGIGTTTPTNKLTIASNSSSQLTLSDRVGIPQWAFRNAGGNLYLSTTTIAGTATSSLAALTINGSNGSVTVNGILTSGGFATGTVDRMAIKNLSLPSYRYDANYSTSTTFSSGTGNFQSALFDGSYMWFGSDTDPGKLVRINPVDNTSTVFTLQSGDAHLNGLTTDGTYIYVSTFTSPAKILKINRETGEKVATFTMNTGGNSFSQITYDGTYIWGITYDAPLKIIKINPRDGSHTTYTMNSGENYGWGIAFDGQYLWVTTDDSPAKVIRFDPSAGTHTTLSTSGVSYLEGIAFDGTNMWAVSLSNPVKVVKISRDNSHFVSYTMNTGENSGDAIIFDGQNLWVGLKGNNANAVLKIDPKDPYNHTAYSMHPSANKISALGYDGVNIWGGTYTNPGTIYRIPNANGNSSFSRSSYIDALPSSIRPSLLIQPASTTSWNNSILTYLGVNATTTSPSNLLDLQIGGSSVFRVNSSSNVGLSTTSPWKTLSVNGGVALPALSSGSTGYYACVNTTTGELSTSTTACGASSEKYKENISDLNYGLAEVLKLRPVSFDYKQTYIKNARRQVGFIAEEVASVTPEVVAYDDQGEIQGLDYPKFSSIIVRAIQDLYAKMNDLISAKMEYVQETTVGKLNIAGELCVDGVCVNKNQLKQIFLRAGVGVTETLPQTTTSSTNESEPAATSTTATSTVIIKTETSTTTIEIASTTESTVSTVDATTTGE